MRKRDTILTTDQKALAVNLDKFKYGSIVEIGAGQEVARRFFQVGAAAGTIAKTMSAYDMAVSDDIYGQPIRLNLLRHLRGEIKFNSAEELAAQIRRDVETARHVLEDAAKERLLTCEEAADQRML